MFRMDSNMQWTFAPVLQTWQSDLDLRPDALHRRSLEKAMESNNFDMNSLTFEDYQLLMGSHTKGVDTLLDEQNKREETEEELVWHKNEDPLDEEEAQDEYRELLEIDRRKLARLNLYNRGPTSLQVPESGASSLARRSGAEGVQTRTGGSFEIRRLGTRTSEGEYPLKPRKSLQPDSSLNQTIVDAPQSPSLIARTGLSPKSTLTSRNSDPSQPTTATSSATTSLNTITDSTPSVNSSTASLNSDVSESQIISDSRSTAQLSRVSISVDPRGSHGESLTSDQLEARKNVAMTSRSVRIEKATTPREVVDTDDSEVDEPTAEPTALSKVLSKRPTSGRDKHSYPVVFLERRNIYRACNAHISLIIVRS